MKPSKKSWTAFLGGPWHGTVIFALLMLPALAAATGPGAASNIGTIGEQELLEPERAFLLSARFKDAKTAEFNYKITDGYYMYRARFKVVAEPKSSAILGKAVFTKGEMKQDATFGRVEIYRNSMRILIPISSMGKDLGPNGEKLLRLKVTSQGCADAGVCYPPLHQILTLKAGSGDIKYPDAPAGGDGALQSTPSAAEVISPPLSELLRRTK